MHNFCETCTTAGKRAQHLWHVHNISETCTYRILENTGWGLWNMLYPICFPLLRFVCFTLGSDLTKHLYSCVCVWGSCAAQVRRQVEQYLQLAGVWTSCWWRQCGRSRRSGNYAWPELSPAFLAADLWLLWIWPARFDAELHLHLDCRWKFLRGFRGCTLLTSGNHYLARRPLEHHRTSSDRLQNAGSDWPGRLGHMRSFIQEGDSPFVQRTLGSGCSGYGYGSLKVEDTPQYSTMN